MPTLHSFVFLSLSLLLFRFLFSFLILGKVSKYLVASMHRRKLSCSVAINPLRSSFGFAPTNNRGFLSSTGGPSSFRTYNLTCSPRTFNFRTNIRLDKKSATRGIIVPGTSSNTLAVSCRQQSTTAFINRLVVAGFLNIIEVARLTMLQLKHIATCKKEDQGSNGFFSLCALVVGAAVMIHFNIKFRSRFNIAII